MALMTDKDICKLIGRHIVIEPYDDRCLTSIGYDFSVGDFAHSVNGGDVQSIDDCIVISPGAVVQILTKEALWLSNRIAGTLHSKVSLVSKGLSHISTTIDPLWFGPLLVTFTNNTKKSISLPVGTPFVTCLFHKVGSPTDTDIARPAFRKDILAQQLNDATSQYIAATVPILSDNDSLLASFEDAVQQANANIYEKSLKAMKRVTLVGFLRLGRIGIFYALIIAAAGLQFYWDELSSLMLHGLKYDTKVFVAQAATILTLVQMSRKK